MDVPADQRKRHELPYPSCTGKILGCNPIGNFDFMTSRPRIAIIGAGMGGLVVAAALRLRGVDAHVYEQTEHFTRLGAGIQMSPNAMRVLRGLGLEPAVRAIAFQPQTWENREWDSGAIKYELPLGQQAEALYGAPYLRIGPICTPRCFPPCRTGCSRAVGVWSMSRRAPMASHSALIMARRRRRISLSAPMASIPGYAIVYWDRKRPSRRAV